MVRRGRGARTRAAAAVRADSGPGGARRGARNGSRPGAAGGDAGRGTRPGLRLRIAHRPPSASLGAGRGAGGRGRRHARGAGFGSGGGGRGRGGGGRPPPPPPPGAPPPPPARPPRGRRARSAEGLTGEEEGTARNSRRRAEEETDPESRARDICLRLLTGAAKSRKQLADALSKREIPEDVAEEVLTRLEEVGLIDDAAFAAAWVESRHAVRGLSRRALAQELRTKGVAADLVEQAVAQLDHDDETDAARALVERKLRSTRGLDPQVRTRRLVGMLARRGYSEGLAFRVVRGALEEEASGEPSAVEWE
ncbi:regulatory protein RecX [Kitasatospora sp. NPDC101157]|uniref:regulatory protein RecX n=1 Tax=Kitasatospora sp. NPDC101157 TaxID=3364098 RepID=UPI00381201D5